LSGAAIISMWDARTAAAATLVYHSVDSYSGGWGLLVLVCTTWHTTVFTLHSTLTI